MRTFRCPVLFTVQDDDKDFDLDDLEEWLCNTLYVNLRTEDYGSLVVAGEDATVSMGIELSKLSEEF